MNSLKTLAQGATPSSHANLSHVHHFSPQAPTLVSQQETISSSHFQSAFLQPTTVHSSIELRSLKAIMASFSAACRLSARLTARQLRQDATVRGMSIRENFSE
jgi:hypothetical protein